MLRIVRSSKSIPPIIAAKSSHYGPSTMIVGSIKSRPPILITKSLEFEGGSINQTLPMLSIMIDPLKCCT